MPGQHVPVMVAMSGGVDSSVAAALLCERGFQVTGIMMRLNDFIKNEDVYDESFSRARGVCEYLKIPLQEIDLRSEFKKLIINEFVNSHVKGITPNPCFVCNRLVKWGLLLDAVRKQGIDWLASGHYARVGLGTDGRFELYKAIDSTKDQSYVLAGLDQSALSHIVLPLGNLRKEQTREIARRYNFGFHDLKESQDLCFTDSLGQEAFLRSYAPQLFIPGKILASSGAIVGEHNGLANYTIGQRKGLGAGNKEPIYVLRKEIESNTLVVGTCRDLGVNRISVTNVNWVNGKEPLLPDEFEIKIRYKSKPKPGTLYKKNQEAYGIIFAEPVRDPTPGQYAVFYKGDKVYGSSQIIDLIPGVNE